MKKKKRYSLLLQVAAFFLIGVITTGIMSYVSEQKLSEDSVKQQTEILASQIAGEACRAVTELPSYPWLLQYWYDHAGELDLEYDADFSAGTKTEEKCRLLSAHVPDLQLRYASVQTLESLSEEDQKLSAEILYSWLITRIDEIKQTYHVDYLFCVATEPPYTRQVFLFSGAEPNSVRGTNYEEVYTLGVTVDVAESQQTAMEHAIRNDNSLANAGNYMDYYVYLTDIDDHAVLIGMTYNLTDLRALIRTRTLKGSTYAVLNQLSLSLLCLALIFLFVIRPLKKVQSNIRLYRQNKDSAPVIQNLSGVHPNNEIGELSEDVRDLAREIDTYTRQIETVTSEKQRVTTELTMATQIQEGMLPNIFPPFPGRTEFDVFASMDPAREVGGDFYDFFLVDDDHLCLVMADVSGKGVPAALFMMASKIILSNNAMMGKSPAQILADTNAAICSNNRMEMFVTVWLGILEISTGKLIAANAGHEYPALMQPGGSFALYRDKHGFVIGGMEGMRYRDYEVQLKPGSKLFLYTDGVPEATNAEAALFGPDRMLAALNSARKEAPAQILSAVRTSVDAFVGTAEQFDDLTMLCLEYNGRKEETPVRELNLEATLENIPRVTAFVDEQLEALDCPMKAQMQIDIAIDELFGNISRYAYDPLTGPATVRVEVEQEPLSVIVTFIDHGKPYDPLSTREPDLTASAEDRPIGGLGVFLVKKTMDDVSYEYKEGKNILRIKKQL